MSLKIKWAAECRGGLNVAEGTDPTLSQTWCMRYLPRWLRKMRE